MRHLAPLAIAFALCSGYAAAEPTLVRVNTFPNARSLPFFVGIEKGFFNKHGIKVEVEFTENSKSQRAGLAAGKFELVHSAVDNAVAMIDVAKVDVVIVSGGDSGTNEFIVQSNIKSFADIRGKSVVVDAPNTAYALQAKKILLKNGLKDGTDYKLNPVGNGNYRFKAMVESKDNAAGVMNLPYSAQAIELGMKSLGRTVDMLGPYQAGGAYVLRSWAKAHSDTLERYIAGYVESLRWVTNRKNRAEAVAMLMEKQKLSQSLAERSYDLMIDPSFGFATDAKFNMAGFKNVLLLRHEVEGGTLNPPERYIDLTYYQNAMKRLGR
ncbi:MAG TPA: ABC transporter substrate-binding protein [Xanthobacteraceae bacterium]|nr:ABC transporter substrate-binding protein [Xanthobacteraceae bacterium]